MARWENRPRGGLHVERLINLSSFPQGKNDDCVGHLPYISIDRPKSAMEKLLTVSCCSEGLTDRGRIDMQWMRDTSLQLNIYIQRSVHDV